MRFVRLLTGVVVIGLAQGCAQMDNGADWFVADLNKYDQNYAPFPTHQIEIGQEFSRASEILGPNYSVVEENSSYRVVAYQKWASVQGPDYVEQTLYMKISDSRVVSWKLTKDTVSIVPRTW